jgi:Glyoxalase-like domain
MDIRIQCLCIDTGDPAGIASFWQSALGWRRTHESDDEVVLEPPAGSPEDGVTPDLLFLRVPEGKVVKNRLHLDLRPGDQAAEVARLEALGARRVSIGQCEVSCDNAHKGRSGCCETDDPLIPNVSILGR